MIITRDGNGSLNALVNACALRRHADPNARGTTDLRLLLPCPDLPFDGKLLKVKAPAGVSGRF